MLSVVLTQIKRNNFLIMPQFDKITFFNQIFWLFVFFSGYYLLLLKVFLPKLGAVLKARSKKLQKGTQGVVGFKQEQEDVSVVFNSSIEKNVRSCKTNYCRFYCKN